MAWLMAAITPAFINSLITSMGVTPINSLNSRTVICSGMVIFLAAAVEAPFGSVI